MNISISKYPNFILHLSALAYKMFPSSPNTNFKQNIENVSVSKQNTTDYEILITYKNKSTQKCELINSSSKEIHWYKNDEHNVILLNNPKTNDKHGTIMHQELISELSTIGI